MDLINDEEASEVTPELMEQALDKAIVRGWNQPDELMRRESTLPGEWEHLSAFRMAVARAADGAVVEVERVIESYLFRWRATSSSVAARQSRMAASFWLSLSPPPLASVLRLGAMATARTLAACSRSVASS